MIDLYDEKIRKWRHLAGGTSIMNLKSVSLQLYASKLLGGVHVM